MKHTFEHGQVPVICDIDRAKRLKETVDENTEKAIRKERERWMKAGNTKIVSFILAVLFFILSYNSTVKWLTIVLMCIAAIFLLMCGCTLYGTKNPDKSPEFRYSIEQIKDKHLYPMSVQFFMLQSKVEITKALLTYSKDFGGTQYATLSLYWINEDDVVEKQDFEDLDVKYKKGIIDTTVDLDNECVIRPFVDSTKF